MALQVAFQVPKYMESQPELSPSMRATLVDWMVEVQENFELNHETLYLGVKLVDRYLSLAPVTRAALQLVGATALFLASKYDERCPPSIQDFLYICDDAYSRQELIAMEASVLCGSIIRLWSYSLSWFQSKTVLVLLEQKGVSEGVSASGEIVTTVQLIWHIYLKLERPRIWGIPITETEQFKKKMPAILAELDAEDTR